MICWLLGALLFPVVITICLVVLWVIGWFVVDILGISYVLDPFSPSRILAGWIVLCFLLVVILIAVVMVYYGHQFICTLFQSVRLMQGVI